ncbi:hypothetical protein QTP86_010963 [Hemibagrus guttatus]|nr:hypothetical protein QTP86_010963 [Hemibagrus guttatus]
MEKKMQSNPDVHMPHHERGNAILQDSKGLTYFAQLCYMAAMEELQILQTSSFERIGCDSLPISLEGSEVRTEVYKYICSLTTGLPQPNFQPLCCDNVLEMIEWFEMSDCYILVLERPSPCLDIQQFLKHHNGRLSEALAQKIMSQVVKAARHCCDAGVLHRDIKAENLLINPDTLEVKLIDFGCGDLFTHTPYTEYEGTWRFLSSIAIYNWLYKMN